MSQNDMTIDNSTGANVRADINSAIQALATNSSGSSAPSTNFASQFFANTSTSIMQLRNTSNNAHINLFTLAGGPAFAVDGTINSVNIGKGANSVAGNTVLGESALDSSVSGGENTAIGKNALTALTSGSSNTIVGANCGDAVTTGSDNVAMGVSAFGSNTTGANNVAMGRAALFANTTTNNNTAVGYHALQDNTASNNTAVGYNVLKENTTGSNNNAVGANALDANTTGTNNNAVGSSALGSNTTGDSNTAMGHAALAVLTTSNNNTAFGSTALNVTTGGDNTGVGSNALAANTSASFNVAVGKDAGDAITTSPKNVSIGSQALTNLTTGDGFNICVGFDAGDSLTTGNRNVCVGTNANPNGATGTKQYVFGHDLTGKGDNTFHAGGTSGSFNEENVSVWRTTSDERIKKNIVNYNTGLSIINQLQIRNFEYKTEDEIKTDNPELTDVVKSAVVNKTGTQLGLIAQEVEAVLGSAVSTTSGGVKTLQTEGLFWHMLNAIKELSAKVTALEAK